MKLNTKVSPLEKSKQSIETSFMSDLRFDVYPDNSTNDLANILEYELERVLDLHAPVQTLSISSRKKSPWFTPEVKRQKHLVRRKEKIWRKYQQDHHFVHYVWKQINTVSY